MMVEARTETQMGERYDTRGIPLTELKSRQVPVEWFEAVAVMQELCRVLSEAGTDPADVSVSARDVVIESTGRIRVALNRAGKGEPAVRKIGELLRMTVADGTLPVPLRLVITQSVSTPPFYASLAELSGALEY